MYQLTKIIMMAIGTLLVTLLLGGAVVHAADPMNAPDLSPVKMQPALNHAPVELVREGQPRAVIYLGEAELSNNVRVLVQEMVETIRLSTGATLPIVLVAPPTDQPAIIIGACEETRKARIDAAKLPIEGFVVKTAPNRVYLVGSTQALPAGSTDNVSWNNDGTAWAMADFLERFVGVRWYWTADLNGRCITPTASLTVPPVSYADQPVYRLRHFFPDYGWTLPQQARWFDEKPLPFAPGAIPDGIKKVAMPAYLPLIRGGSSWPYRIKVHEPQRLWKYKSPEWLKSHAAMFALKNDGTRNLSMFCYSTQETFDYLIAGCEVQWDKKDNGIYPSFVTSTCVTVSPADDAMDCHCAACLATAKQGGYSLVMGQFVKRMCDEVKKRWPDKKVMYLPYWNYQDCPESVDYPGNLEIKLCLTGHPMALMRQVEARNAAEVNIRAWSKKIGGPITTWDYSDRGSGWTYGPLQYPHVVRDFYQTNRKEIAGTFLNGGIMTDWTTSAPTLYVWMKVMWNPDIKVDAVLDEMCRRLYGKAGGTVRELLQLECERWEKGTWTTGLADQGQIPPALYREIWPPEVVARMKALRDKALTEMADDPVARQRFLYWTWTFDAFLKDAGTVGQAAGTLIK
jgi:hypothetical protein